MDGLALRELAGYAYVCWGERVGYLLVVRGYGNVGMYL